MRFHVDTDFLVFALSSAGPERERLLDIAGSEAEIGISSVAWYEFSRGPRTPEQRAVAESFFVDETIVSFSQQLAEAAAEVFRSLGSPRRRGADIAIGVTAAASRATLLTRNARDFAGIPALSVEASEG